ncbi:MAG TPA: TetR family transcriptional regulator C-terminal domain-containing protein [Cyclobacteriaceae bacterium]|nr:TetR family transcriptional regulator C-terminal domain-containing protein [Cyclobacteriaceae bacterium]
METTKRPKKKSTSDASRGKIESAYKEYVLMNGAQPASVFKFCFDQGMHEDEFYRHFGSFEGLEKSIWKGFIDETIKRIEGDKSYLSFNAQEKILAFYYTLLETLKASRSFVMHQLRQQRKLEIIPGFLKDFRTRYEEFIGAILNEGMKNGEIAKRPYLDKQYPRLFWTHFSLLILFWRDDESASFEKTDAYVEKSVRLAFDIIGNGVVDSALDFARFIYQSKIRG